MINTKAVFIRVKYKGWLKIPEKCEKLYKTVHNTYIQWHITDEFLINSYLTLTKHTSYGRVILHPIARKLSDKELNLD